MLRRFAIVYLALQAVGAAGWWLLLLTVPASRGYFLAPHAPDATLLAFGLADGLLFILASALAAFGLARHRGWAWPVLLIHAGAAAYAALYCWLLFLLTGAAVAGAVLMTPSLVVPGWLAWQLRPEVDGEQVA